MPRSAVCLILRPSRRSIGFPSPDKVTGVHKQVHLGLTTPLARPRLTGVWAFVNESGGPNRPVTVGAVDGRKVQHSVKRNKPLLRLNDAGCNGWSAVPRAGIWNGDRYGSFNPNRDFGPGNQSLGG